eukprot:9570085-Alexandrium_andersonii.AAC.1
MHQHCCAVTMYPTNASIDPNVLSAPIGWASTLCQLPHRVREKGLYFQGSTRLCDHLQGLRGTPP